MQPVMNHVNEFFGLMLNLLAHDFYAGTTSAAFASRHLSLDHCQKAFPWLDNHRTGRIVIEPLSPVLFPSRTAE